VSQRKSVFSDILRKNKEPEPKAAAAKEIEESEIEQPVRKPAANQKKLNKATSKDYVKLTAYIPRVLHTDLKRAMLDDGELDQSKYIELLIRTSLESHSATVSKHSRRATG
jgi:hypothetical protein